MLNDNAFRKLETTPITKKDESDAEDEKDYQKGIAVFKKFNQELT